MAVDENQCSVVEQYRPTPSRIDEMALENLDSVTGGITEVVDHHTMCLGIGVYIDTHPLINRDLCIVLTAAAPLFAHAAYCAGCEKIVSESRVWERSNFGRF